MKIQSSAKILSCFLLLSAIHVMATPVEINSNQTDYTFRGDTTYFVDANVTLYGTTTFENGTILKYNGSGQLNIDSGGTIVCPKVARPAIFTSMNDDSVGDTNSGSSGTPATGDVNTFLVVSNVTLSNMCFYYANAPLLSPSNWLLETPSLQNCEFFYDGDQEVYTTQVFNNLFVGTYVDWWPGADDDNLMMNNTFVNCGMEVETVYTDVSVSDNLFDSSYVTDFTGVIGGDNAFYDTTDYFGSEDSGLPGDWTLSSDPDFQTGPLGNYYLPSGSPLIDTGNTDSGSAGLASFTTQASQTPDSGTVDIGYHYPIWSYVVIYSDHTDYTFQSNTTYFVDANVTLSGTTTFESGTILKYNDSGLINIPSDGTIVCPSGAYPAIFTSYNDNTVGVVISGSSGVPATSDVYTFLNVVNVALFDMRFSYAFITLESPSEPEPSAQVTLQNCEFFYDANVDLVTPTIFNNLFVESYVDWYPSSRERFDYNSLYSAGNYMLNNTFVNCGMEVDDSFTNDQVWVEDNLFDSTAPADFTAAGVVGGYNAFYSAVDYLGADVSGLPTDFNFSGAPNYQSGPNFQSGPLGNYYLPGGSLLLGTAEWAFDDIVLAGFQTPDPDFDPAIFTTSPGQGDDFYDFDIGYHYFIVP